jgi:ABC-type Na+ transport system ATPase subunit NatA
MKMTDGTIIAVTICSLILLAGGTSILSKWITTRMEIKAYQEISDMKRETIRIETEEMVKRIKLHSANNE